MEIVIEIDHAGEGKLAPSDAIVGHWRVIGRGNRLSLSQVPTERHGFADIEDMAVVALLNPGCILERAV